ncbi:SymE family type I addiction module toxin [Sphingobacterium multivorum]|uniref:SymE family type I addiction module toxin n=1 Tax=Sphingobacterium multivorum TaxID=28454 RepID=UPI003DA5C63A
MASHTRQTTLQKRYRKSGYRYGGGRVVPELRLSGVWLEEMGFTGGQKLDIRVSKDRLIITRGNG